MSKPEKNIIEFGLIGASGRGLFLSWEAMKTSGVRMKAAADPSENSRKRVKKAFGNEIQTYHNAETMFRKHPEINTIFIASPDAKHYENVLIALKFKKNIYVEKPLAQHIKHCNEIVDRWEKNRVVFCGGLEFRYIYLSRKIKEFLAEDLIGNIAYMSCAEFVPGGNMHLHPLYRRKETGRSLLLQKGVHDIDLLNWFSDSRPAWVFGSGGLNFFGGGEEKNLKCFRCSKREVCRPGIKKTKYVEYLGLEIAQNPVCAYASDVDMEDNYQILIGYKNHIRASFLLSYNSPEYYHEFVLGGAKGKLKGCFDHRRNLFTVSYKLNDCDEEEVVLSPPTFEEGHGGGDSLIIKNFLECVRENKQPIADIYAARDASAVAAGGQDSIESFNPVLL